MRAWAIVLPILGVFLIGCSGRRPPEPAVQRGVKAPQAATIVVAEPSPAGDRLALGLYPGSGASLRHFRRAQSPASIWLLDLRTGAAAQLPSRTAGLGRSPMWSVQGSYESLFWRPGGGALAFASAESIEVFDLARGSTHLISLEGLLCGRPVWSLDGRRLLFEARGLAEAREASRLYSAPADSSAPPRPETDGPTNDLWVLQVHCSRSSARSAASAVTPRQHVLDQIGEAVARACSPDRQRLAYSGRGDARDTASLTIVDRSLTPLVLRQDLEAPARTLVWSPDSRQLLARNSSGETYLLDPDRKAFVLADDPVIAGKEPVGWVQWNGKWQIAFIDETWKRLVITAKIGAPVYTLVTLNEDGSPVLVLPIPKEK